MKVLGFPASPRLFVHQNFLTQTWPWELWFENVSPTGVCINIYVYIYTHTHIYKAYLSKNQELCQVYFMVRYSFRNVPGILPLLGQNPWNLYDCSRMWQLIILWDLRPHKIWSLFFCCKFWWPAKKYTLLLKHSSWELESFSLSTSHKQCQAGAKAMNSAPYVFLLTGFSFSRVFIRKLWVYWLEVNFIFILGATGGLVIYYICEKENFLLNSGCAWVLSHVWLFANPWTVVLQAPLSMGFSR